MQRGGGTVKNYYMIRLRGGRSQTEVAGEMGIPVSTYAMVENGSRFPRKGLLQKFVDFYGVTVDALFFNRESIEHNGEIGGFTG